MWSLAWTSLLILCGGVIGKAAMIVATGGPPATPTSVGAAAVALGLLVLAEKES